MAATIKIPGRRITDGETFYTDWSDRGGDCILLRVEILVKTGVGLDVSLETRGDDGTSVTTISPTSAALTGIGSVGMHPCVYLASITTGGAKKQVRVVVGCNDGSGGYFVTRIMPLIFFDNAKP